VGKVIDILVVRVKELFENATAKPHSDRPLEGRNDMRKQVDASYYGYNLDEEDGTLLEYEAIKEKEAFENLLETSGEAPAGWEPLPGDDGRSGEGWKLPTLDEVQEELVERRRRRLLDKLG
jgi:pre-mRNA-splicing factor ISY1